MEILGILAQCRPMILYREKTQIRFCINITDTGKREKMLHFFKLFVAFPWVETSTGPGGFMNCVFII